jgi:hypothetical protein
MRKKVLHGETTTIVLLKETRNRLALKASKDQTFDEVIRSMLEKEDSS